MSFQLQTTPLGPSPTFDVDAQAQRRTIPLDASLAPAFVVHGAAVANLERLSAERALCVTTGQQPGLLTGPLFTIYKALSAIALARSLETRLDRPVVPVFWVSGDDHDLAEANHFHLLTVANEIRRVALREREPAAPLIPLYKEPVGDDVQAVITAVTEATPDSEFRPAVLDWIQRHYQPGTDLATAFGGALAELLGRYGLVVFHPTHHAAKRVMASRLIRALEQATQIDSALESRGRSLKQEGKPVPIAVGEGATTVMIESQLGRDRLVVDGDSYHTRRSRERWSLTELHAVAEAEPERLSPNVLLRPVMEAAMLPTVAYVAGPAELAYLPQADPIYQALDVEPQARVARWSGRVVETRVSKVLEKFGIAAEELDAPEGQLEARMVRDEMPDDAAAALKTLRKTLDCEYERLAEAAGVLDQTLKKPVQSAGRGALRNLADVEKRLIAHLKKRNEIVVQQLAKARHNLYPLKRPQERVLNVVPFLIRYGDSFVDQVFEHCAEWSAALETTPSGA